MKLDWTHIERKITDIRKVKQFYIISVEHFETPLFVDHTIFEARIKSYYLRDTNSFTRQEVLDVKWNLVINLGFYHKLDREGQIEKIEKKSDKFYLSFLEINGVLGHRIPGVNNKL